MPNPFIPQVSEEEIKKERAKAREMRKSRWWMQRRAKGLCHYCRRHVPPSELTLDHVVPLVRGGKTTKGNVAAVCKECNTKKKYLLPMEWQDYLRDFRPEEDES